MAQPAWQTPDWNGYGVTNDSAENALAQLGGKPQPKKRSGIGNALSAIAEVVAPEQYRAGKQRMHQNSLADAMSAGDYKGAAEASYRMGDTRGGMYLAQYGDQQGAQAEEQERATRQREAQGTATYFSHIKQGFAQQGGMFDPYAFILQDPQGFQDATGMTPDEFQAETGGQPLTPEMVDMIISRSQAEAGIAPAGAGEQYTLAPGARRFAGDGQMVAENPKTTTPGYEQVTLADGIYEYIPGQPESMRRLGSAPAKTAVGNGFEGGGVQSTFTDSDGNLQMVMRDGTVHSSGMGVQNPFQIVDVGGVKTAINRRTGEAIPINTPEEAGTNEATVNTIVANEEDRRTAQAALPKAVADAQLTLDTIDSFLEAPLGSRYGASSMIPAIPGTEMATTQALIDQLNGQVFLDAYASLRGAQAITDIEGQKATAAQTRLQSQGIKPSAARQAAQELREIVAKGMERAQAQASGAYAPQGENAPPLVYNPETGEFE